MKLKQLEIALQDVDVFDDPKVIVRASISCINCWASRVRLRETNLPIGLGGSKFQSFAIIQHTWKSSPRMQKNSEPNSTKQPRPCSPQPDASGYIDLVALVVLNPHANPWDVVLFPSVKRRILTSIERTHLRIKRGSWSLVIVFMGIHSQTSGPHSLADLACSLKNSLAQKTLAC